MVRVEIELPDQVAEFLKLVGEDIKTYCEEEVISSFGAELDNFVYRPFEHPWSSVFGNLKEQMAKLKQVKYLTENHKDLFEEW